MSTHGPQQTLLINFLKYNVSEGLINLLKEKAFDLDITFEANGNTYSPLGYAMNKKQIDNAFLLLRHGASLEVVDESQTYDTIGNLTTEISGLFQRTKKLPSQGGEIYFKPLATPEVIYKWKQFFAISITTISDDDFNDCIADELEDNDSDLPEDFLELIRIEKLRREILNERTNWLKSVEKVQASSSQSSSAKPEEETREYTPIRLANR